MTKQTNTTLEERYINFIQAPGATTNIGSVIVRSKKQIDKQKEEVIKKLGL